MTAPVVAVAALPHLPLELVYARAASGFVENRIHRHRHANEPRGVVVDDTGVPGAFVLRSVSVLVDASDAARARGVVPGMRVIDAQQHAPDLQCDVVTHADIARELAVVAEVLLAYAPVVEPLFPARSSALPTAAVALDLTGMVRPVQSVLVDVQRACARLGHAATVVASPGTRLSHLLACDRARREPGTLRMVQSQELAAVLGTLPVEALALPADLSASLHALGVRTAADVARVLPLGGVERIGAFIGPILDVLEARFVPLHSIKPPERVLERMELDHPLCEVEPLLFVLSSLCGRLCMRMRARRQQVAELMLTLARRHNDPTSIAVPFPNPITDDKAMLRALHTQLERTALGGPVDTVVLEAVRVVLRHPRQLGLEPGARAEVQAEEALHSLLAELSSELGQGRVGCLALTDDRLPERMTRLAWPPPQVHGARASRGLPKRRRARRDASSSSMVTQAGRFLAGWPWPLRMLEMPVRMGPELPVLEKEVLGVLEGVTTDAPQHEDCARCRYERAYVVLTLVDGRRALALVDEETEETWLQGWFD